MSAPIAKALVWMENDPQPFLVADTPAEVEAAVEDAEATGSLFICLTLATPAAWDGKPLRVRADRVVAMTPPRAKDLDDDEDDDDDE